MRKFLVAISILMISLASQAQLIRGSVKKNADPTKIDIVFKADYTSATGEYILYFQFSLAIPVGVSAGVTATAVGAGTFSNFGTLSQGPQYTEGSERIFTWIFATPAVAIQTWTSGVDFVGIVATFSSAAAATVGKMVDFTNIGGGGNTNTYYAINSTVGDVTPYGDFFFAIPGESFTGIYSATGDQFVQTGMPPPCPGAVGGTASGSADFCLSGTPTITAIGFSTGTGSGYQWMSSTNAADYPASGTPVPSQTNSSTLTTGVVSTTTHYWLRVTCTSGTGARRPRWSGPARRR